MGLRSALPLGNIAKMDATHPFVGDCVEKRIWVLRGRIGRNVCDCIGDCSYC